jgi:hypothetical protein
MTKISDVFGNEFEITPEEVAKIELAIMKCKKIQENYYPNDGSKDHIDYHIYGQQCEVVAPLETELDEKYQTSFNLW